MAALLGVAVVLGFEVGALLVGDAIAIDNAVLRPIVWALAGILFLEAVNLLVYMPITIVGNMWKSFWLIALPRDVGFVVLTYILLGVMSWKGFLVALMLSQAFGIVLTFWVGRADVRTRQYLSLSMASR